MKEELIRKFNNLSFDRVGNPLFIEAYFNITHSEDNVLFKEAIQK